MRPGEGNFKQVLNCATDEQYMGSGWGGKRFFAFVCTYFCFINMREITVCLCTNRLDSV